MPYADHSPKNRTRSLALVAIVHVGVGYALLTGLAGTFITDPFGPVLQTEHIPIPLPPEPLPPEPVKRQPVEPRASEPINVPVPPIQLPSQNPISTTTELPQLPPTPLPPVRGTGIETLPLPPVEQTIVRSAAARGDPARWISDADYPTRALRDGRQGTSAIRWEISVNGRVENCTVAQSSGSPDLDRAACAAITRRGRYEPALDATGSPIRSTSSRRVVWRVPAE